jgi:hypothetical protein
MRIGFIGTTAQNAVYIARVEPGVIERVADCFNQKI